MERHTLTFAQKDERSSIKVRSWDSNEGDDHLAAMFDGDMSEVLNPTYGGLLRLGRRSAPACWVYFTCAKLDQDDAELQDHQETVRNTPTSASESNTGASPILDGTTLATAIVIPDDETTPAASTPVVTIKQAAMMTTSAPSVVPQNYEQLLEPFKPRSAIGTTKKLAATPDFHMLSPPDQMIAEITHCNSVTQYNAYKSTFFAEYKRSVEAREQTKSIKRWSEWGERQLAKRSKAIGHVRPQKLFRMISCWVAMGELRGLADPMLRSSGGTTDEDNENEAGKEGEREVFGRHLKRRKIRGDW